MDSYERGWNGMWLLARYKVTLGNESDIQQDKTPALHIKLLIDTLTLPCTLTPCLEHTETFSAILARDSNIFFQTDYKRTSFGWRKTFVNLDVKETVSKWGPAVPEMRITPPSPFMADTLEFSHLQKLPMKILLLFAVEHFTDEKWHTRPLFLFSSFTSQNIQATVI